MKPINPFQDPPPEFAIPSPAPLSDPLKQLRVLYRSKWQILRTALLIVLLTALIVFVKKPAYLGSATIQLESAGANVVKIDEVYEPGVPPGYDTTEYQNTQLEVLRSRMIAAQVFEELKLDQYPEYQKKKGDAAGGLLADARALVRQLLSSDDKVQEDDGRSAGVDRLMTKLHINPVMRSNLVKVNAESQNAELSAKIANAVVEAYVRYDKQSRGGVADEASGWLTERLAEVKKDLEASELSLQKFYESEKLVNVGGARGLVEAEITDNSRELREARGTKTNLQNVYSRIVSARGSVEVLQEIPQIAQEPLVQTTKRLFLEAQSGVGSLQVRYGAKHPKMIAANARLDDARDALRKQVLLAADGIRSQYEVARSTETSLASVVESSRSQIQGLDRNNNQMQMLQREVDSNRKLYDTFLQRSKETDVAGKLDIGKVRVVEPATIPRKPYKPRKALWLNAMGFAGLFLGILIALLRSVLDDTLKTPLDLEQAAAIPALTALPKVNNNKKADRLAHMELDQPSSIFAEGIRTVRTSVLLADVGRKRTRILITSAVPGEGKTSVALNLAMAFGQVERVLLIDADLRKPTVGARLKLPAQSKGLTELISGTAEFQDCVHRYVEGNIDVLPCGKLPPNPLELVSSQRFEELIKSLSSRYDRVVIDSPPCQPVSDSLLLARCADAVIFLVKADSTRSRMVSGSIKALRQTGAPLVGAVLNEANMSRQSGFAYGYYYYQGGYGSYKAQA